MADPGAPMDFTDFSARVARQAGVSEGELTDRRSPNNAAEAILVAKARTERAPESDIELLQDLVDQYLVERQRVVTWLGSIDALDERSTELFYGDERLSAMPTHEELREALVASASFYADKYRQGFTRLLVVPFGATIERLTAAYQGSVAECIKNGELLAPDGSSIDFQSASVTDDEIRIRATDTNGTCRYVERGKIGEGITKRAAIQAQPFRGWQILLVEDIEAEDLSTVRPADAIDYIDRKKPPILTRFRKERTECDVLGEGPFIGEIGLTPESYLALADQYLYEHGKVLDTEGSRCTVLLGVYKSEPNRHIYMGRPNEFNQLTLGAWYGFDHSGQTLPKFTGVRTAVPVDLSIAAERKTWVE